MSEQIFEPHSLKQDQAIFSDSKITVLATGIQFGKTSAGAIWMKRKMHECKDKEDNFIICSPSYKIMQQSTLGPFLKYMDGYGTFNKVEGTFKMHNGSTCYFRTGTEPDSVVGITNVRAIWGDEAGKYSLYFWENIQARSSFKDCPILLTTSPYTLNWLYKEVIKPKQHGLRQDVTLIRAASIENPYFPVDEYNRRKETMDRRRFDMMYGGDWIKMSGLVYDCFNERKHIVDAFPLPTGTKYYAGVDWGYLDPFVIVVHAVTPQGMRFQVSEFYKAGLTISEQIKICITKQKLFDIERFYCDLSCPSEIEELNRCGVSAAPADNTIRLGIDRTYESIKSDRFKIIRNTSPYTLDEMDSYHYPDPKDLLPDQSTKELVPVDQSNHCLDAIRYCVIMTSASLRDSFLPKRKQHIKLQGNNRTTEKWG